MSADSRVPSGTRSSLFGLAVLLALGTVQTGWAQPAIFPADRPAPPGSLKHVPVPLPPNLGDFVADKQMAIVLGKALFWDERVGSDGNACASCHFHAGADNRIKNQLDPGLRSELGAPVSLTFNPTASGGRGGPNYTLKKADFPFHRLANPEDRNSAVLFDSDDVVSSQGVFNTRFTSLQPYDTKKDNCVAMPWIFNVGGINVRNVEPRNSPTVINAIFNFRNFWDGRANNIFNGRNPFGPRDPTAGIDPANSVMAADAYGNLSPMKVSIPDASLASQAVGPPLSEMEMSCLGRTFELLGRKMLSKTPLLLQTVDPTDSVLGPYARKKDDGTPGGKGLTLSYEALIKRAFHPKFWSSTQYTADGFRQIEKNFALFWGLAIMLYESTLVSDDTPFDQYVDGNILAMTPQQVRGFQVFNENGGCVFCHAGAEFTNAATHLKIEQAQGGLVEGMLLGDGSFVVYDNGFYNIGARPSVDDIGAGGNDPWGNPLSWSRQAKQAAAAMGGSSMLFNAGPDGLDVLTCSFFSNPCMMLDGTERDAMDGAFKTPTLRNVELTGPYMHHGGEATLEQVIEFYNRGGNARGSVSANTTGFGPNPSNLAPTVQPLRLPPEDRAALAAFLKALTDERVRWEKAPFDHPELHLPNGHPTNEVSVVRNGATIQALDTVITLPAVGAAGRAAKGLPPLKPFEANLQ